MMSADIFTIIVVCFQRCPTEICFCIVRKYYQQECIPVGCLPAARRPYAGVCFRGVPGPGGLVPGGCLVWGGGVCSGGGGCAPGEGVGIPACTEADTPPPCGQPHTCENITLAQLRCGR